MSRPWNSRRHQWTFALLATLAAVSCTGDTSDEGAVAVDSPFAHADVVEVVDGSGASLGSVAFPVSCTEEAAASMRLGLAQLHNMTYSEAREAFESAAAADPSCALAHWGVATTLVHPLWPDVPTDAGLEEGWGRLQQARAIGFETAREEAYAVALEAYFRDGVDRTERERLASYAEAWARVADEHPGDPEAALFAGLSMNATAQFAERPAGVLEAAGARAESVLAAIPDHPGAHHYIIHAYDSPRLAERALPVARSYGQVAPENAHALHMTSHIFTRRGLWQESIDYNARSAEAADPIDGAVSHHHLHAVDYLAYAYLQRGEDARAEEVLTRLRATDGPVVDHAASAYAFAAVPVRLALERRDWRRAAEVEAEWPASIDWDAYPHLVAMPVFAQALGAAHLGDLAAAEAAIERLGTLAEAARAVPGAYDWGTQVRIQQLAAHAWLEYARGDAERAVSLMTEAASTEAASSKNPVTPGEVLPAQELLGDLLLDLERYAEAREAYDRALGRSPNRLNSLAGAARAADAGGDPTAAAEYRRLLQSFVVEDARTGEDG